MNRVPVTVLMLALASTALASPASAQEWMTLFDGSSLDGWRTLGNANWKLGDGAVSADTAPSPSFQLAFPRVLQPSRLDPSKRVIHSWALAGEARAVLANASMRTVTGTRFMGPPQWFSMG